MITTRRPGAVLAAAALALGLFASPSLAGDVAETPAAASAAEQSPAGADLSSAAAPAATSYWTPERMRDARPAGQGANGEGAAHTRGPSAEDISLSAPITTAAVSVVNRAGTRSPGAAATALAPLRTTSSKPIRTIGKVFYSVRGADYVCSGNSVRANNRATVATAGHCVHTRRGGYAKNWIFVPGFDDGWAPYGVYPARKFSAPKQWTASSSRTYDSAFVAVGRYRGKRLADRVGASPVAFSKGRLSSYATYGYPVNGSFSGWDLKRCAGRAFADSSRNGAQGISCTMRSGASGGPWFLASKRSKYRGSGVQNSNSSYGYGSSNYMFGPYWGQVVKAAYTKAARA